MCVCVCKLYRLISGSKSFAILRRAFRQDHTWHLQVILPLFVLNFGEILETLCTRPADHNQDSSISNIRENCHSIFIYNFCLFCSWKITIVNKLFHLKHSTTFLLICIPHITSILCFKTVVISNFIHLQYNMMKNVTYTLIN